MHILRLLFASTFVAISIAPAETPVADLVKPPADALHLIISSTGGKHGDSWIWGGPDGSWMGRESMVLRGQVFELDSVAKENVDGLPSNVTVRGFTPTGDAGETFTMTDGEAKWKSPIDAASSNSTRAFYKKNEQDAERADNCRTRRQIPDVKKDVAMPPATATVHPIIRRLPNELARLIPQTAGTIR